MACLFSDIIVIKILSLDSFAVLQAISACFCVYERNPKWLMIFSEAQRGSDALYLISTHLRCFL